MQKTDRGVPICGTPWSHTRGCGTGHFSARVTNVLSRSFSCFGLRRGWNWAVERQLQPHPNAHLVR